MPEIPLEIDVAAAQALLNEGPQQKCLLLDCRTPEEHTIAFIAGAKLLPMQEITDRVAELEPWRNEQIVVHCHHGMRSLKVTQSGGDGIECYGAAGATVWPGARPGADDIDQFRGLLGRHAPLQP